MASRSLSRSRRRAASASPVPASAALAAAPPPSSGGGENVRVAIRLRPQSRLEEAKRGRICVEVSRGGGGGGGGAGDGGAPPGTAVSISAPLEGDHEVALDRALGPTATQAEVYSELGAPLAERAVRDGIDVAVVAYGPTGAGKTHTMMGEGWGEGGPSSSSSSSSSAAAAAAAAASSSPRTGAGGRRVPLALGDGAGLIPRMLGDVFGRIAADGGATYTVRLSYVEIYMERVFDLLDPTNRGAGVGGDGEEGDAAAGGGGGAEAGEDPDPVRGAASLCCLHEADALALLARGNAYRKVGMEGDGDGGGGGGEGGGGGGPPIPSHRSHAMLVVRLERRDEATGEGRTSRILLADLAGSELAPAAAADPAAAAGGGGGRGGSGPSAKEAGLVRRSFEAVEDVVRALGNIPRAAHAGGGTQLARARSEVPYRRSRLTGALRGALGGRCATTLVLAASPSTLAAAGTLASVRFGQRCRRVRNHPGPNVDLAPASYRRKLAEAEEGRADLERLARELAEECRSLKEGGGGRRRNGPLWDRIDGLLADGGGQAPGRSGGSSAGPGPAALREELASAKGEAAKMAAKRDRAEKVLGEVQSQVAALRTQNEGLAAERRRDRQDLADARREIQIMGQRKLEVEHNLRVSQFRENEATVFLRQFRRFYRRLLKNKATQGTGTTGEITGKVSGVPDLNDLIDVDTLLLESGLIEEAEMKDDTGTGPYRPSSKALLRSTAAASSAADRAASDGFAGQSILSRGGSVSVGQIADQQKALGTPSGQFLSVRESNLERDLHLATERCIELQIALNEEKSTNEEVNRTGSLSKQRLEKEANALRQALQRKTHDLQAIIWKMNELHLINKTYNEKMANREQHVTYLEDNLADLQSANRRLVASGQDTEKRLRGELASARALVQSIAAPLWQLGEYGTAGTGGGTLAGRVIVPVHAGPYPDGVNWAKSPLPDGGGFVLPAPRDASGGTTENVGERRSAAPIPRRRRSVAAPAPASASPVPALAPRVRPSQSFPEEGAVSYAGGRAAGDQSRRFTPKRGREIRGGVLKGRREKAPTTSSSSSSSAHRKARAKMGAVELQS